MEEKEENIFYGKSVDEAIIEGLQALNMTLDEVDVEVIEEAKKKLFTSTKAKVKITKKQADSNRSVDFINKLLSILKIDAKATLVADDGSDNVKIDISTTQTAKVIGKRGDVLDAIQSMAGAVANIGRDDYKKVVVDCENYRTQREDSLKALAKKLEKMAVTASKKVILEPMNPYERRIIHAALVDSTEVKTASEGKEPQRYVVVIPNGCDPKERGIRYGANRSRQGGRNQGRGGFQGRGGNKNFRSRDGQKDGQRDGFKDRPYNRERGERSDRGERGGRGERPQRSSSPRAKKEIIFGTYLGNSQKEKVETTSENTEKSEN